MPGRSGHQRSGALLKILELVYVGVNSTGVFFLSLLAIEIMQHESLGHSDNKNSDQQGDYYND